MAEVPHILSAHQFDVDYYDDLFAEADSMKRQLAEGPSSVLELGKGTVVATLFYEASTRTRLSFEASALRLGMGYISTENAREYSSAVKGESLEHTILTVGAYADIIVMRHYESGAADRAATVSTVPIINAGDGGNEHPTQTQLDMYTIKSEKGRLEGQTIVLGGDLKHGRVMRSDALAASNYDVIEIIGVSRPELQFGEDIVSHLKEKGVKYTATDDLYGALRRADVVMWSRTQLERFLPKGVEEWQPEDLAAIRVIHRLTEMAVADTTDKAKSSRQIFELLGAVASREIEVAAAAREAVKVAAKQGELVFDEAALQVMKPDAILGHPLPISTEITPGVDKDPRAIYLTKQVPNGIPIRMVDLYRFRRHIPQRAA
jgi:aspartate carbamoyltransferase catalytic subunit